MPPPDVVVRSCQVGDLPALAGLLSQLHPDEEPLDPGSPAVNSALDAVLGSADRWLLVAVDGERLVGTLDCIVVRNLTHDGRPYALVENVVVDAAERGRGVGRALMEAAVTHAVEAGCYKLQLMSRAGRSDAHAFYERAGFTASAQGYRRYLA